MPTLLSYFGVSFLGDLCSVFLGLPNLVQCSHNLVPNLVTGGVPPASELEPPSIWELFSDALLPNWSMIAALTWWPCPGFATRPPPLPVPLWLPSMQSHSLAKQHQLAVIDWFLEDRSYPRSITNLVRFHPINHAPHLSTQSLPKDLQYNPLG